MSIRLIIADKARELDDVFKLRHDVYVVDQGRFSSEPSVNDNDLRIVDRFDTIPDSFNIIAYEADTPVACMRVNKDSDIGLPPEIYFDFSETREKITKECKERNIQPVLVSGSMLAIKEKWRNRRSIIRAIFRTATNIMHGLGATHVIGSISEESHSLYGRMGFKTMGDSRWFESVGDRLVPMMAPFDQTFQWAFGEVYSKKNYAWLDGLNNDFERVILSAGEVLFYQEDKSDSAYVIEEGWISISRTDKNGNEMVLSNLSVGELFGELAIFDHKPRSATATALTNTEVSVIPREQLLKMIKENPEQMGCLLGYFAKRLRDMDEHMMQIFAPQAARIQFELHKLWHSAVPDSKSPAIRVAKVGPEQIARSAHVQLDDVMTSLEHEKIQGNLDYTQKVVRFYKTPVVEEDNEL